MDVKPHFGQVQRWQHRHSATWFTVMIIGPVEDQTSEYRRGGSRHLMLAADGAHHQPLSFGWVTDPAREKDWAVEVLDE